jgi:transcriptional regulator with XRE-family HTH domain
MAPQRKKAEQLICFNGEELVQIRKERGWTADRLVSFLRQCPECGSVDKATVSRWEKGHVRPGLAAALALERITGVPVATWYAWEGMFDTDIKGLENPPPAEA